MANGWIPCLSTIAEAEDFSRLGQAQGSTVQAHLTLDTGMGRGGFLPEGAPDALEHILTLPTLRSPESAPTFRRQMKMRSLPRSSLRVSTRRSPLS